MFIQIKINIVYTIIIIYLLIMLFNKMLNLTEFCFFAAISFVIVQIITAVFDIILHLINKKQ
jgi:hypothetical protein